MATKRTPRIILVEEDQPASEVGVEQIASVRSGIHAMDAVSALQGEIEPEGDAALTADEIGAVVVELTDKEAEKLQNKPGIVAVEEDELAYALQDDVDFDGPGDVVSEDPDATAEIDALQSEIEAAEELPEEMVAAAMQNASLNAPDIGEEIDFDEAGNAFSLAAEADPVVVSTAASAGIPRHKIVALIRCIIKCALKELTSADAADVSEEQVAALLAAHGVSGDNEAVQAIRDYITCGLRIIYATYAWRYSTGGGVRVAVVDTGITPRHPDLRVYGGASFVPGVGSWADDHGHGTHVAGTIAARRNNRGVVGVAPYARLYGVKVLNRNGSGRTSSIIAGLVWCYRTRMHVVNLSLGSRFNRHDPSKYSRAYERAGRLLRRRGILAVAAAGNSNEPVGNPARCPSFMAVSAVDCARRRASFSCFGPQVEIAAPGVGTWSTYPPNRYRKMSGTSMATPHVAGVAALVKRRHPSWGGDTIRVHLWRTATDLGVAGKDYAYGFGLVNAYRAVR